MPTAFALVHAAGHAVEFVLECAAAESQLQPTVTEHIEQRCFARHANGVAVGRNNHGCSQSDPRCVRACVTMVKGFGPAISSIV
jgi:hypothetical protein